MSDELVEYEPVAPYEIRLPDGREIVLRAQHVGMIGARGIARALHPGVIARVLARIARGAARASYGVYWLVSAQDLTDLKGKKPELLERKRMGRLKAAAITAAGTVSAGAYGWVAYPGYFAMGAAALTGGLYLAGKRPNEEPLFTPELPSGPLVAGVSGRRVVEEVNHAFADLNVNAQAVDAQFRGWGWEILVMSRVPVAEIAKTLARIEVVLSARPGSLTATQSQTNASAITIRALTGDPLSDVDAPIDFEPGSKSILDPVDLGVFVSGQRIEVMLAGGHIIVIGVTGSGKSSSIWTMLNHVTACHDAIAVGADLSDGPALNAWSDLLPKYAKTYDEVKALLEWCIDLANQRSAELGKRLRPSAESDPNAPVPEENHQPTAEEPAVICFLDEFPLIAAHAELMDLVRTVVRVGRKGCVSVVIASQRTKKDELGDTTIRDMCTTKIMHACSDTDVQQLIGPGMIEQGWVPNRLTPSQRGEGVVIANDAGRLYIWSPSYTTPELGAARRLNSQDVWSRTIMRLRHGRIAVVPGEHSLINRVRGAFREAGDPVGMKSAALAQMLGMTESEVFTQLGRVNVGSGKYYVDGVQERGYRLDAVLSA